jgi:hypothetical protein
MPIAAPEITFVTTTENSVTVALTPPPSEPTFDHILVFAYDYATNAQVHVSAPIFGLSYTIPSLEIGRIYIVTAIAVDTSGDYSDPAALLVVATTDSHDPGGQIPNPTVVIVDVIQESREKVYIEYRLEDSKEIFGELTLADYSFNGTFSDAVQMKEAFGDPRHEGRFNLQFDLAGSIVDPHHIFIWDISELPDFDVHTYAIRLQGKSGAVYSVTKIKNDVDLDTTPLSNLPVPAVITGTDFVFTVPLFYGQDPVTGAAASLDELRDDTDTDVLGGAVPLPELGATGVYQDTVNLAFPAGRYRAFISATAPDFATSIRREVLIVSTSYQAVAQLNHPALCLVYGRLVDNLGRPLQSATVTAFYKREPSRYDRVSTAPFTVRTDEFGFFALHLLRNTEVQLFIRDLQYDELLKIPDAYTATFTSIQFNQPSVLVRGVYGHVLPIDLQ